VKSINISEGTYIFIYLLSPILNKKKFIPLVTKNFCFGAGSRKKSYLSLRERKKRLFLNTKNLYNQNRSCFDPFQCELVLVPIN